MIPISICIIGKNEEKNIETCLSSIPKNMFEIIYVDTGSSDKTIQIAKKYTDKIFHFKWIDDFSAARNFSIKKASNDWILVIDCDENITYISMNEIQSLITKNPTSAGILFRNNLTEELEGINNSYDLIKRLFNRLYFHYVDTIHEQLVPIVKNEKFKTFNIPLELFHTGYTGTIKDRTEKSMRNINLLEKELESNPASPYVLFQLGQSYYFIENFEQAIIYFAKALSFDVDPKAQYVKILIISYGYALSYTNHLEDAIIICEEVYPYFKDFADFIFLCGFLYMKFGPWEEAVACFLSCMNLTDRISDVTTPAFYNLGCIYKVLGNKKQALYYFSKVPTFNDSANHIKTLKNNCSQEDL